MDELELDISVGELKFIRDLIEAGSKSGLIAPSIFVFSGLLYEKINRIIAQYDSPPTINEE